MDSKLVQALTSVKAVKQYQKGESFKHLKAQKEKELKSTSSKTQEKYSIEEMFAEMFRPPEWMKHNRVPHEEGSAQDSKHEEPEVTKKTLKELGQIGRALKDAGMKPSDSNSHDPGSSVIKNLEQNKKL